MNTPVKAHPSIDPRVLDSPHTPYGRMEGAVDGAVRIVVSVGWACRVITRILWYPCDDCGLALPRTNDVHGGYAGRVVPHVRPPRVYGRMAVWAYWWRVWVWCRWSVRSWCGIAGCRLWVLSLVVWLP